MAKQYKQLQYQAYGQGINAPWKVWGEYKETKKDAKGLNEDYKYLKDNHLVRIVQPDSKDYQK